MELAQKRQTLKPWRIYDVFIRIRTIDDVAYTRASSFGRAQIEEWPEVILQNDAGHPRQTWNLARQLLDKFAAVRPIEDLFDKSPGSP